VPARPRGRAAAAPRARTRSPSPRVCRSAATQPLPYQKSQPNTSTSPSLPGSGSSPQLDQLPHPWLDLAANAARFDLPSLVAISSRPGARVRPGGFAHRCRAVLGDERDHLSIESLSAGEVLPPGYSECKDCQD
jgi:hypothetical protein